MSSGLESFHKILKDETRRKIILLIDEKGSVSYSALMKDIPSISTGLLNYHLKVLDDLLAKDEKSKYILTEKGKRASQMLIEFPYEGTFVKMRRWERKFWKGAILILISLLVINLGEYFLGYISSLTMYINLLWIVPIISVIYVFEHFMKDVVSEKIRQKYVTINNYAKGLVIGFLLWFVVTVALGFSGFGRTAGIGGGIILEVMSLAICLWLGITINKHQLKKPKDSKKCLISTVNCLSQSFLTKSFRSIQGLYCAGPL